MHTHASAHTHTHTCTHSHLCAHNHRCRAAWTPPRQQPPLLALGAPQIRACCAAARAPPCGVASQTPRCKPRVHKRRTHPTSSSGGGQAAGWVRPLGRAHARAQTHAHVRTHEQTLCDARHTLLLRCRSATHAPSSLFAVFVASWHRESRPQGG